MSDIAFGMAGNEDIEMLTALRLAYLREDMGDIPSDKMEKISGQLPGYFKRHLGRDMFAYGAWRNGEIIGCCFLIVTEKPANPGFVNGLTGTVMNVYVKPGYRRRGIAKRLMKMLIGDSAKMGLDFIELKATEQGHGLYKLLGFEDTVSHYHSMRLYTSEEN